MALRRRLDECGVSVEAFFSLPASDLAAALEARPSAIPDSFARQEAIEAARHELDFCDRHSIRVLFPESPGYPLRLLELSDAPTALFALGSCDLNAPRTVAFVGTRTPTPYGLNFTRTAVEDLQGCDPLIVSGLAYASTRPPTQPPSRPDCRRSPSWPTGSTPSILPHTATWRAASWPPGAHWCRNTPRA